MTSLKRQYHKYNDSIKETVSKVEPISIRRAFRMRKDAQRDVCITKFKKSFKNLEIFSKYHILYTVDILPVPRMAIEKVSKSSVNLT